MSKSPVVRTSDQEWDGALPIPHSSGLISGTATAVAQLVAPCDLKVVKAGVRIGTALGATPVIGEPGDTDGRFSRAFTTGEGTGYFDITDDTGWATDGKTVSEGSFIDFGTSAYTEGDFNITLVLMPKAMVG